MQAGLSPQLWDLSAPDPRLTSTLISYSRQTGASPEVQAEYEDFFFTNDSDSLIGFASSNGFTDIVIWAVDADAELSAAKRIVMRPFSKAEWEYLFPEEPYPFGAVGNTAQGGRDRRGD